MAKQVKEYGARTRAPKGRLKPQPKQGKASWQKRNEARGEKQAVNALTVLEQQAADELLGHMALDSSDTVY